MRSNLFSLAATLTLSASALGQAKVVISEIMYNPASTELKNETEWVEIANVGTEAIDLKDWHLDDEDKGTWGKFACTLAPGGVAVLVNKDKMTEEAFRAAWDATHDTPEGSASPEAVAAHTYQIIGVTWGGIANSPSAKNEILQLLNENDEVVCEVKQGRDFPKIKGTRVAASISPTCWPPTSAMEKSGRSPSPAPMAHAPARKPNSSMPTTSARPARSR